MGEPYMQGGLCQAFIDDAGGTPVDVSAFLISMNPTTGRTHGVFHTADGIDQKVSRGSLTDSWAGVFVQTSDAVGAWALLRAWHRSPGLDFRTLTLYFPANTTGARKWEAEVSAEITGESILNKESGDPAQFNVTFRPHGSISDTTV